MGGIRLDWEIESKQSKVEEKEDAALAKARRVALFRLALVIAVVLAIVGAIVAAIMWRLNDVETRLEQLLIDTVDSEVAALRVGDRQTFLDLQRSATNDWIVTQGITFESYQALKSESNVQLTGQVLDVEINRQRGRVKVQEILEGVPYTRVWFYWHYEDGWRHVPPDYTFWGNPGTVEGDGFTIRYQSVDAPLAEAMADRFTTWLSFGCRVLICGDLPWITVDIVPGQQLQMAWQAGEAWQLVVPSPYVYRARSDIPFSAELQLEAATLVAERLVSHVSNGLQPMQYADAAYLKSAVTSWLIGKFVQIDAGVYLIESLSINYGEDAVGRLVQLLQPGSSISVLSTLTGVSLDQASLDWRDFVTWRLALEDRLVTIRNEANWLALYDTRDDAFRNTAYARYVTNAPAEEKTAVAVRIAMGNDGTPQLHATLQVESGDSVREEVVIFNLVNGVWLRAS